MTQPPEPDVPEPNAPGPGSWPLPPDAATSPGPSGPAAPGPWPGAPGPTAGTGPTPPPQGYGPPPAPGYGYGPPPAGVVPTGLYLDPVSGLNLPQGTQLASVGRRIGAWFLAIPLAIVTLGIGYVIWGLIIWGRGQTPALQVLGMRCWRPETGKVAGWPWMALREIVGRFVDGVLSLITYIVSFVFMVSRKDRRCLHDLIAGTVVLHDPDKVLAG